MFYVIYRWKTSFLISQILQTGWPYTYTLVKIWSFGIFFAFKCLFSLCSKQNMSSNSKGPMLCRLKVYSSRTSTLTMVGLFLRLGFHIEGWWYYMRFGLLWTVFKKMFLDFSIQVLSCSLKYSKSPGGHPRWINLKTLCKKELI